MNKPLFYLDTNAISQLADPGQTDGETRRCLAQRVRSRVCEIVGAVEVIEELAGIAHTKPKHFARSIAFLWTLVGDNVLVGQKTLMVREIKKGTRLSRAEAFHDGDTVHRLRGLPLDDTGAWKQIAKGVRGQGEEFANGMQKSAHRVAETMLKKVRAREIRKYGGRLAIDEKTVKDWYSHVLRLNRDALGLPDDETMWADVGLLPCTRAFVSILIALTKKHHMSFGTRYRLGDQHDVGHYASAAMADYLVTADRALRNTTRLITWRPVPVMDIREFVLRMRRL